MIKSGKLQSVTLLATTTAQELDVQSHSSAPRRNFCKVEKTSRLLGVFSCVDQSQSLFSFLLSLSFLYVGTQQSRPQRCDVQRSRSTSTMAGLRNSKPWRHVRISSNHGVISQLGSLPHSAKVGCCCRINLKFSRNPKYTFLCLLHR